MYVFTQTIRKFTGNNNGAEFGEKIAEKQKQDILMMHRIG